MRENKNTFVIVTLNAKRVLEQVVCILNSCVNGHLHMSEVLDGCLYVFNRKNLLCAGIFFSSLR